MDLPFKAEYAKSNRSSCKKCRDTIGKDSLRLALMVQSPMFDGKIPNWFHFKCFWDRAKVPDPSHIHGFDSLRWEDQEKIKSKVGGGGDGSGSADKASSDYSTEYAKSKASKCRGCEEKIDKDEVRISKKDYDSQRAKMYGPQPLWYHVDCFVKDRDTLEFTSDLSPTIIVGFAKLKKEDQDAITEKLGKGDKKRKAPEKKGGEKKLKKEESELDKTLREQNQLLWKVRDQLTKEISSEALKGLLEYNDQQIPSGESRILDAVSDCMVFGALQPCTECKDGQLKYTSVGYKCTGNLTSWTKCMAITKEPKRKAFKIPKEYHDVDFLKNYKYVKRERAFPIVTADFIAGPVSSSVDSVDGSGDAGPNKPLSGMTFTVAGKLSKSKGEITKIISELGGKVVAKMDKKVAACISNKDEVAKNSKLIKDAKSLDIQVVSEEFLGKARNGGIALLIQSQSICSWGSDPNIRISEAPKVATKSLGKSMMMSAKDEARFTKSVPKMMKMTVKGGAAVDPDSGLEGKAHVLEEKGNIYNAVLGLVDLVRGTNSYYKLQILESDGGNRYWLFRSWGRVGTTIGNNKLESCGSKAACIDSFLTLYGEKTGNDWADRKNFVKHPNRFYPLDIDYGADDEEVRNLDLTDGSSSKLPKAVQDIVRMIFDVESMKKAMLEFEIDLKKMPLGKLSKKQIKSAYTVLNEVNELIKTGGTQGKFLDASNRFYTLIPHDFGMKKPPLLDTEEIIKSKTEMLDNLLDIEVAYSMLKTGDDGGKDPLDSYYEKLKTDIKVVDKKSELYDLLTKYVKNTHASTHDYYDLEVMEIMEVDRKGELSRYKPFKALNNRQLLWHGSRNTNYAGILSQGLRIAPPEAPVTGYMFGKGVYFADMVSKSANYCRTTKSDPIGILLLCEVALGNMYELKSAKYVSSLPKGTHSTKGVGMTTPDPKEFHTQPDGVVIPMGKGINSAVGASSLLYNEYIVYDTAQINIKYMLKTKFNFKSYW